MPCPCPRGRGPFKGSEGGSAAGSCGRGGATHRFRPATALARSAASGPDAALSAETRPRWWVRAAAPAAIIGLHPPRGRPRGAGGAAAGGGGVGSSPGGGGVAAPGPCLGRARPQCGGSPGGPGGGERGGRPAELDARCQRGWRWVSAALTPPLSFPPSLALPLQAEVEQKKKRTFRKFTYRGVDLDQLLDMS